MVQRGKREERGGEDAVRRSHGAAKGYGLCFGSRTLRVRPLVFWAGLAGLFAMAVWSAGTAAYFTFRDDLLTALMARQADMQVGYEDRIATLRSQVDKLTTRQLLNQEQVEQRIEQLARRQATLDARAKVLTGSGASASPVSVENSEAVGATPPAPGRAKPSPLSDGEEPPSPQHRSGLSPHTPTRFGDVRHAGALTVLGRIEEALDQVETRQRAALLAMEDRYDAKARRIRSVLTDLGVDVGKIAAPKGGIGGPFVPLPRGDDVAGFERQLNRVELARAHADHLSQALSAVPVRQPLPGEIETSSGFGVRMDPFMRAPAMHSGLDLRAAHGEPVRATAAGKVVSAGWSGGYGRMVEIDHGNGFSTRYGHLSQILVREDQMIAPGQVIARVGSTGRSTGPHLHYETRIDGEAVDPVRFLRAGLRLSERPDK